MVDQMVPSTADQWVAWLALMMVVTLVALREGMLVVLLVP